MSEAQAFRASPLRWRAAAAAALPFIALAIMLAVIIGMRPLIFSYFGFMLLFKLATPLVLASLGQMLIIMLGDIDLSIGSFVGLVTCITSLYLGHSPVLAVAAYVGLVVAYAVFGLVIHVRGLPSIVVTLGMSFIWLGAAVMLLPAPGGLAPAWLTGLMSWRPPLLPLALWVPIIAACLGHVVVMRSSYGTILRGAGANPRAIARAGWSILIIRVAAYAGAGVLGVLSGLTLTGLTTSGDANIAPAYTLISVGAVILGGGTFTGGVVFPVGTVVGALVLSLAGSLLSFMQVPPSWQIGAQGAILFLILAGRVLLREAPR